MLNLAHPKKKTFKKDKSIRIYPFLFGALFSS